MTFAYDFVSLKLHRSGAALLMEEHTGVFGDTLRNFRAMNKIFLDVYLPSFKMRSVYLLDSKCFFLLSRHNFLLNFIFVFWSYFLNVIFVLNFINFSFFKKFIYVVAIGLGFRKKRRSRRGAKFFELFLGIRHRLSFQLPRPFYIMMLKRSNIIFLSNSKKSLLYPVTCFRNFRKENFYKLKGFFTRRRRIKRKLSRVWAFARRVKFREVKLKLSKKQKII
jgi:hypothetical protein